MEDSSKTILPDAKGLFYALRSMGYENTAAIADLVDNSIDAQANNIWVTIADNPERIFIVDDGEGMSIDDLQNAFTLGKTREHETEIDLGKYGLGLITASLSIGKVLRIITKQNGLYNTAILDYEEICKSNQFVAPFRKSNSTEKFNFDSRLEDSESGTILIIDKCDKLQYTSTVDFVNALRDSLAETFHKYIRDGKNIFINGEAIAAYDPLYLNKSTTKKIVDCDVNIDIDDTNNSKIHVIAATIEDQGTKINRKLHFNIAGQGFYVLRNNREIAAALEFPEIYKKHNDLNLLRIELSFSSDLDDLMGINLKKHDVTPSKQIIDRLYGVLNEPVKKYRDEVKAKQKAKKDEKKNPFAPEVPTPQTPASQPGTTPPSIPEPIKPVVVNPPSSAAIPDCTFEYYTRAGEPEGPFLKLAYGKNNGYVIFYNLNNAYYKKIMEISNDSTSIKQLLNHMVGSNLKAFIRLTKSTSQLNEFVDILSEEISKSEHNNDGVRSQD